MDTQTLWMGLDLGESRTHLCVIDDMGETVHEEDCDTTVATLSTAISAFPREQIGMIGVEAGGARTLFASCAASAFQ